jgi:PAS domain S-box-containing protein
MALPRKLSLRAHLVGAVVCSLLSGLGLAVGVLLVGPAIAVRDLVLGGVVLLITTLGVVLLLERQMVRFMRRLVDGARAVAEGQRPRLPSSTITELEELGVAIEAAGTTRHHAEQELRRGEARLASIVGTAMDAIICVDETQAIILFNAAAERMFGCRADEALGLPVGRFVSQNVHEILVAAEPRPPAWAHAEPAGVLGAALAFRADGSEIPIEVAISTARAGAQPIATLILRDISERVRAEAERASFLRREQAERATAEAAAARWALLAEASSLLASSLGYATLGELAKLAAGTIADWCVIDLVEMDGRVERVAVAHVDPAKQDLAHALQVRYPPGPDGPATLNEVFASGRAVLVPAIEPNDIEARSRTPEHERMLRALGIRSLMVVPLTASTRIVGAITFVRAAGAAYTTDDLAVAEELAHRTAVAVDNAQLHAKVNEARERFARLVEGLDAIVWEANPLTLRFVFVSQRAEALLGYPVHRWLDEPEFWVSVIHPEDRARTMGEFERCAREGRDCRLEYRAVAADGRTVWLDNVVRVVREPGGSVATLHGFMIDVTERKRMEEERNRLLASEQAARAAAEAAARRSKFVAEASEILASSLDYEATLTSVTQLAVPMFADWCLVHLAEEGNRPRLHAAHAGSERVDVAKMLEQLTTSVDFKSVGAMIGLLQSGAPLLVPDISTAWLETVRLVQELGPRSLMIVPLLARGRPLGTLTFVRTQPDRRYEAADLELAEDLAHRAALAVDNARLYQQAEAANRTKDEFLATLSHELRTPLTAMLGWVLVMRSSRASAEHTERALTSIERNTRLQAQLISDLLDISRITAGKLEINRRPVDLRAVIEHALEDVRHSAEVKTVRLGSVVADQDVPVLGDALRLQQVVVNLLANAVKFTPAGGRVDVTLSRHGSRARITVTDTGVGVAAETLPHIFESFRQGDVGARRAHSGLGLGLTIVRHLVEVHGGTVTAHSEGPGRGATFVVELPVTTAQTALALPAPGGATPTTEVAALPRLDGVRVLVVDDHADAIELVDAVLSERGAEVHSAGSVPEALGVLRTTYVDILLTDIGLPNASGYDLIREVRDMEREHGGRLPAVALTAYAGSEDRERTLAAGFVSHLTKPFTPEDLVTVVARAISRPITM